jgi:hypothetical protein
MVAQSAERSSACFTRYSVIEHEEACLEPPDHVKEIFMKSILLAGIFVFGSLGAACAQADMSCADLLKANKQIEEAMKGQPKDADSTAMDKKINDYCIKNPNAKASEAMEKALQ